MAKQLTVACVGEVLRRSLPCASVDQGSGLVILVENKMVTGKQTKVIPAMESSALQTKPSVGKHGPKLENEPLVAGDSALIARNLFDNGAMAVSNLKRIMYARGLRMPRKQY